jgi:hypothetical protein
MSTDEWNEMSRTIRYGLNVAHRRMLEQKARRNETMAVSTQDGKIELIPARKILKKVREREKLIGKESIAESE